MNIAASVAWHRETYPNNGPGMGEPCCNWVAKVLRRAAGLNLSPYFREGGDWWAAACIWEGRPPMSPVGAYQVLVASLDPSTPASDVPARGGVTPAEAGAFVKRHGEGWYAIQGWRPNGTGHQVLLRHHVSPAGDVVVDSTEARGHNQKLVDLPAYLDQFDSVGIVALGVDDTQQEEAPMAEEQKLLGISAEVSEEVLAEVKQAAREALAAALAKAAEANEDGKIDATDAGDIAGAVLDEVLDSAVSIVDALLPLPEPYESLVDMGLDQLGAVLKAESGPLDDIADAVVDLFDGPEVEDIERKLAKHAYRFRVQGKKASHRKMLKHAMRMLRHFPGRASVLGISGELGNRSSLVLEFDVYIPEGADVPAVRPR